ncbi:MAG: hypothetical protein KAS13_06090 [Candidatus Omnitrophica bacterium]|nr:hypothetical protein [Candidatus Omnitrophota bacterium]
MNKVLNDSQQIASQMKYEYVSQEHIFKEESALLSQELKKNGVREDDILKIKGCWHRTRDAASIIH